MRSLPSCVGIFSIYMPRPCHHHNKKQWNCMGGCVRSLIRHNTPLSICSLIVNPLWLDNYSCTCNHSVTIQGCQSQCHNTGMPITVSQYRDANHSVTIQGCQSQCHNTGMPTQRTFVDHTWHVYGIQEFVCGY